MELFFLWGKCKSTVASLTAVAVSSSCYKLAHTLYAVWLMFAKTDYFRREILYRKMSPEAWIYKLY